MVTTKFIRAIQAHQDTLGISDFSRYTEAVYKRWFQQLQRADASFRKSKHSFITMTMPEIKQRELPTPTCLKNREDLDFLPKNIMEFMIDPANASHWLLYTAKVAGRTINVHIVHYPTNDNGDASINHAHADAHAHAHADADADSVTKGLHLKRFFQSIHQLQSAQLIQIRDLPHRALQISRIAAEKRILRF